MMNSPNGKSEQVRTSAGIRNGLVNHELLLQNEHLAAENRILRSHLPSRLRLSVPERESLAEIARAWDRALAEVARVAKPDTILRLVSKTDCGKVRRFQASVIPWPSRVSVRMWKR